MSKNISHHRGTLSAEEAAERRFCEACREGDLDKVKSALAARAKMSGLGLGLAAESKKYNVFDWLLQENCPVNGDTWLYSHVYGAAPGSEEEKLAMMECSKIFSYVHSLQIAKNLATEQGNIALLAHIAALEANKSS